MSQVAVHITDELANKTNPSVSDGEQFLTAAKDKSTGIYQFYQPDREDYEFVGVSGEYIESIDSQNKTENSRFVVWGDKTAWDDTPSPIFNI